MERLFSIAAMVAVQAASMIAFFFPLAAAVAAEHVVYSVVPSDTDPNIHRAVDPHKIIFDRASPSNTRLLVFLPGTAVHPADYTHLLGIAAEAGYRVVGLEYYSLPAVAAVCAKNPDPACSGNFREKRIYGNDLTSAIDDTAADSIINRLTKLLAFLEEKHRGEGWGNYLVNGAPNWGRIAVGGSSQGAGMAALIAKHTLVPRVVLLSSPFDTYSDANQLAPWILSAGTTPADRWYGAYHQREPMASVLKAAYEALGLGASHVRVLNRDPLKSCQTNCFHLSTAMDRATPLTQAGLPAYFEDCTFLLGQAQQH